VSGRAGPRRTGSGSLGQNFLIDPNIIDVISRLAALSPEDVVLEIGGGEGILTRRLVAEASFVQLIEIDPGLADGLVDALDGHGALHVGDAVSWDLASLVPAPTRMVANLPYSVAATVVLKTVFETAITDWVVMVQKEVGERFAAAPGSAAYGIPSVLAQLSCDVRVLRPVSRNVFRPIPNVDSVLLGLHRRSDEAGAGGGDGGDPRRAAGGGHGIPGVRSLVHDAFSHRRKAMARSVSLSRGGSAEVREAVRAAVVELGFPADVRAERLAPGDFAAVAERIAA
jgi:16S rRNA (adenine1518-N6/adenine1519-N6)-dimethyltransferase